MTSNPTEIAPTLADQLRAAVVRHRDAQEVAGKAASKVRKLVVELVDAGMKIKDVAAIAGVSSSRIHGIIVTEESRP